MTTKNFKTIVFASLIAVLILPFSGMINADAKTSQIDMITKPELSTLEKDLDARVSSLVDEANALMESGADLKDKYQNDSDSLTASDIQRLDVIQERLSEIKVEFGTINAESVELYAMDRETLDELVSAQKTLLEAEIPGVTFNGVDQANGALYVGFDTQNDADASIEAVEEVLDVPFYVEIGIEENYACANRTDDCNPLQGGIQIVTDADGTGSQYGDCSYSIPAVRNVYWWTETGFVTAGHCFSNQNGNDVWQPDENHSKIGDLTLRDYQDNGECDCAFVQKSGSESTLFGYWNGNQLYTKSDPSVGSYVWAMGQASVDWGKVTSNTHTSSVGGIDILNTLKLDSANLSGTDSGGVVWDMTTGTVYHGLVKGGATTYTVAIPWTHIDAGLDLQ